MMSLMTFLLWTFETKVIKRAWESVKKGVHCGTSQGVTGGTGSTSAIIIASWRATRYNKKTCIDQTKLLSQFFAEGGVRVGEKKKPITMRSTTYWAFFLCSLTRVLKGRF